MFAELRSFWRRFKGALESEKWTAENLLFHNSRLSLKKKKRGKQKQCVETDGCSFCDGVPPSLCFTVAAAERQSRPAVTWWAGQRPRWPLRLSGTRLHHRLHRQTRGAHVPRQMVTSSWGFVPDWGAWLGVEKSHLFIYIWSCNMLITMSRLGSGRFTGALLQTYSQKMKLISWAFESAHCYLFCLFFSNM